MAPIAERLERAAREHAATVHELADALRLVTTEMPVDDALNHLTWLADRGVAPDPHGARLVNSGEVHALREREAA